ncbi:MAG: hypothetical protein DU429_01660 [Candidatus Tokpelaia sp.]|nr:MAG: hypothetical protein DU430_03290 [Candidatus Tokpelaia sp.]KAA6207762.1 MAG: hypothetical protein DU429_01660 [Candidatus Tokpelaia sp.]
MENSDFDKRAEYRRESGYFTIGFKLALGAMAAFFCVMMILFVLSIVFAGIISVTMAGAIAYQSIPHIKGKG